MNSFCDNDLSNSGILSEKPTWKVQWQINFTRNFMSNFSHSLSRTLATSLIQPLIKMALPDNFSTSEAWFGKVVTFSSKYNTFILVFKHHVKELHFWSLYWIATRCMSCCLCNCRHQYHRKGGRFKWKSIYAYQ